MGKVEGLVGRGGGSADGELLDAGDGTAGSGGGVGVVEDEGGPVGGDGSDVGGVGGEEVGEVDACIEEAGQITWME